MEMKMYWIFSLSQFIGIPVPFSAFQLSNIRGKDVWKKLGAGTRNPILSTTSELVGGGGVVNEDKIFCFRVDKDVRFSLGVHHNNICTFFVG